MKALSPFFQLGRVALLGIISLGCSSTAPKPADPKSDVKALTITSKDQKTLFPFAEGNTWIYTLEIAAQATNTPKKSMSGELRYTISKVFNDSPTASRAIIDVFQGTKKSDTQEWGCDDKGLFIISTGADHKAYSSRQPILHFPIKDQDSFKWEGSGTTPVGKPGKMTYAYKYDGTQMVDTDMGQMNAAFMQSAGVFKTDSGEFGKLGVNSWYCPGVGLVRYRQEIELKNAATAITLRLKSYNVKK